jgi:hypothetical protein
LNALTKDFPSVESLEYLKEPHDIDERLAMDALKVVNTITGKRSKSKIYLKSVEQHVPFNKIQVVERENIVKVKRP